jgi:hypothetical protein
VMMCYLSILCVSTGFKKNVIHSMIDVVLLFFFLPAYESHLSFSQKENNT